MLALILAAILAVTAAAGGVIAVSDNATPGDALYGVDRTVERVRLKTAGTPEARAQLLSNLTTERLQEAGDVAGDDDGGDDAIDEALEEYFNSLDELLATVVASGDLSEEELTALLETLDGYDAQLEAILGLLDGEDDGLDDEGDLEDGEGDLEDGEDDLEDGEDDLDDEDDLEDGEDDLEDGEDDLDDEDDLEDDEDDLEDDEDDLDDEDDEDDDEETAEYCVGAEPHPVGMFLATSYNLEYDEIMSWFCSGFGFGEIKFALSVADTGSADPIENGEDDVEEDGEEDDLLTAEEILAMKTELGGWGRVRQELGLIGNGKNKNPHQVVDPGEIIAEPGDDLDDDDADDEADDEEDGDTVESLTLDQQRPGNGNRPDLPPGQAKKDDNAGGPPVRTTDENTNRGNSGNNSRGNGGTRGNSGNAPGRNK